MTLMNEHADEIYIYIYIYIYISYSVLHNLMVYRVAKSMLFFFKFFDKFEINFFSLEFHYK